MAPPPSGKVVFSCHPILCSPVYQFVEESIYKIIPPEAVLPPKLPLYKSTHSPVQPPTASSFPFRAPCACPKTSKTFGPHPTNCRYCHVGIKTDKTNNHENVKSKTDKTNEDNKDESTAINNKQIVSKSRIKLKPPIPSHDEKPLMNLSSSKNFITSNAVEAILSKPYPPEKPPDAFLTKPDYGKIPEYLQRLKEIIVKEGELIRKYREGSSQQIDEGVLVGPGGKPVRALKEEERQQLVDGLKMKWEQLNREYHGITHIVKFDTIRKVRKKEYFEYNLSQIEKDLEKLNRGTIYLED